MAASENNYFESLTGLMYLQKISENFTFGEAIGFASEFNDQVVFQEPGVFPRSMLIILADKFHEEGHLLLADSARGSILVREILEDESTGGHSAHVPGADAA